MKPRGVIGRSIRGKTMAVVLATTVVALLVNAAALLFYEATAYRGERRAELSAQVEILGRAAAPALAFNDRKEADAALAAMKSRGDIVRAALFRTDGTEFASFEATPPWRGARLRATYDIVEGGQPIGSVELVIRSQLHERLRAYGGIVLAVMVLALGAALALSAWLQRVITQPVLDIDAAARSVLQRNDYSVRARRSTDDEVGALADAFNRMLAEIDRRTGELTESETRFRLLADSAPVLMWLNDVSGAVFVNRAYLDFVGVSEVVDVQRFDWAQFVHPEDRAAYIDGYLAAVAGEKVFSQEFRFRRHDGQFRWMRSVGVPRRTQDGTLLGYTGCTFDVHDAREATDALRAADRRKDEFLAVLAHELRNPLAPIRNALYLLKMQPPGATASAGARDMMDRQVTHMVRLIDDLLDVSRINTGKLKLHKERIDVGAVARGAVEAIEAAARTRQHRLTVSVPPQPLFLSGDATRLSQVFQNLLNNAVKFTEPGGAVAFELAADDGVLVARVRDTGIGLAPDQLEPIFEMFNQADRSLERSAGGLGVGLALARRLVELHGGTIVARSDGEGRGTEFVVRIPGVQQDPSAADAADRAAAAGPTHGQRILVVDDNADAATSLAAVLRQAGNDVRVELSGTAGLAVATTFRPHWAVLDIGMPGLNGYEVARRLRAAPETRHVKLVAVTGYGQPADREAGQAAGFHHYLVKPVAVEQVLELLGSADAARADDSRSATAAPGA